MLETGGAADTCGWWTIPCVIVSLLLRLSNEVDAVLTSVVPPCVLDEAPDSLRMLGSPPREVVLRCEYGTIVSRGGEVLRSSRLARPACAPPSAS